jgi:CRP-like cAMP-binding protein
VASARLRFASRPSKVDHSACRVPQGLIDDTRNDDRTSNRSFASSHNGAQHAPNSGMSSNELLARLSRADSRLLADQLEPVELPLRKQLEARNRRVDQVYFLDAGLASVVANGGHPIEVGMIGREGMTGLSVVLDGKDRAVHETFMQMAGKGQRLSAGQLRKAIGQSTTLHQILLQYAHAYMIQTTQTALSNGRSKIEERLARWLLMAHDRTDRDELSLTHEFLATMLGVRRSGVTIALQQLERTGLVAYRRGRISILDREALEQSSNGAYLSMSGG